MHSAALYSATQHITADNKLEIQLAPLPRSAVCTELYFLLDTTMSSTEFTTEVMAAVLDDE